MTPSETNLSSDEMAALCEIAVPVVSQEVARERSARVKVESYNFRQPGRLSAAQLRALKVVHEFFAKRLSEERSNGLNLFFELSLLSVETVSYSNFMGSLGNPCFMAQLSSRFDQDVLLEIDLPIARLLVSRILGEKRSDDTNRPLTSIEQAIAGNWLEGLLPLLNDSWKMSAPIDFGLRSIEVDPRFVQVMPDDSPVVSLTFLMQSSSLKGQMTLCYPLEQLQDLLEGMSLKMSGGNDEDGDHEHGSERIMAALKSVPFSLRAELGCCSISASQLATLARGDVLCLDRSIHDPLDLFLEDSVIFKARLGRKGENLALQICSRRG
jgi:flagellar motor switch protein FliM